MTVYNCYLCEVRHPDWSANISMGRGVYYEGDVRLTDIGCYGCPQCAKNCCPECAEAQHGICPCGGELVPNAMFRYSGDGRLPEEISQLPTVEERVKRLQEYCESHPIIKAEYDHYLHLIEMCNLAREPDGTLPESPGLVMLRDACNQKYGISPWEAYSLISTYAVPSNVDRMLELFDERCFESLIEFLSQSSHDTDEEGWSALIERVRQDHDPRSLYVPVRSPEEIVSNIRKTKMMLRAAVERLQSRRSTNSE